MVWRQPSRLYMGGTWLESRSEYRLYYPIYRQRKCTMRLGGLNVAAKRKNIPMPGIEHGPSSCQQSVAINVPQTGNDTKSEPGSQASVRYCFTKQRTAPKCTTLAAGYIGWKHKIQFHYIFQEMISILPSSNWISKSIHIHTEFSCCIEKSLKGSTSLSSLQAILLKNLLQPFARIISSICYYFTDVLQSRVWFTVLISRSFKRNEIANQVECSCPYHTALMNVL
jgi:hypothetical protein